MKSTTPRAERSRSSRFPTAPPQMSASAVSCRRSFVEVCLYMYASTNRVAIDSRVNHHLEEGPSERLIAPKALKASVKRTYSPTNSWGTYDGHKYASANRLLAMSAKTTPKKTVQNLFALCGMNIVEIADPTARNSYAFRISTLSWHDRFH